MKLPTKDSLTDQSEEARAQAERLEDSSLILESKLNKKTAELQALLDSSMLGYARCKTLFDADGVPTDYEFIEVNEAYSRITGLTKLVGRRITEVVSGVQREIIDVHNEVTLSGVSRQTELYEPNLCSWFRVNIYSPERGQFAALFSDITERKRAEEKLKLSHNELDMRINKITAILNSITDSYFELDSEWCFVDINENALLSFGKQREEVIGQTYWDVLPQTRGSIYEDKFTQVMSGADVHFEVPSIALSPVKWFDIHAYPSQGGISVYFRDITDRKRAESELIEREAKYRNLFENMTEEVHLWRLIRDDSDRIKTWCLVDVNPPTLKTWGYSSVDEIRGKTTDEIFGPGATEHYMPVVQKIMTEGVPFSFEDYFPNLDKYFRFTSVPMGDFFITTGADITGIKKAEQVLKNINIELENKVLERTTQLTEINNSMLEEIKERRRTEQRLRSAQKNLRAMAAEIVMADERSRQQFAADLHDTVIQTIGAAKIRSQLIQTDIPKKSSKEFQEMQDLISQSITQARFIMAEMSPPVLNELGFIPAMEWLTEQIENQHGINIEFQAANGFTPLQHEIQVLLFQATRELLMNVVKHAHADKVLVKMSAKEQKIRIEVIDDGKGFDKRQAFRTDVSSGGFGLFSIRERVRHFGGNLFIQSEAGKGTRVVVTAPHNRGGQSGR